MIRRLQIAALVVGVCAIVFVVLSPAIDDPVVIVKGNQVHFSLAALTFSAATHDAGSLTAIIAYRHRLSSPHHESLIEVICTRLC